MADQPSNLIITNNLFLVLSLTGTLPQQLQGQRQETEWAGGKLYNVRHW